MKKFFKNQGQGSNYQQLSNVNTPTTDAISKNFKALARDIIKLCNANINEEYKENENAGEEYKENSSTEEHTSKKFDHLESIKLLLDEFIYLTKQSSLTNDQKLEALIGFTILCRDLLKPFRKKSSLPFSKRTPNKIDDFYNDLLNIVPELKDFDTLSSKERRGLRNNYFTALDQALNHYFEDIALTDQNNEFLQTIKRMLKDISAYKNPWFSKKTL